MVIMMSLIYAYHLIRMFVLKLLLKKVVGQKKYLGISKIILVMKLYLESLLSMANYMIIVQYMVVQIQMQLTIILMQTQMMKVVVLVHSIQSLWRIVMAMDGMEIH